MKNRQKELIGYLLVKKCVKFDTLQSHFNISRRTLYYDIEKINEYLHGLGTIDIQKKEVSITGDFNKIFKVINQIEEGNFDQYLKYTARRSYILEKIFMGFKVSASTLATEMYISHTTIKDTIKRMKHELKEKDMQLTYSDGYKLSGNEIKIRELYLESYYDTTRVLKISNQVEAFNNASGLRLTDYSKNTLTAFVAFVSDRINKGYEVNDVSLFEHADEFQYYDLIDILFEIEITPKEQMYISAFISSLSSLNTDDYKEEIEILVDRLINKIEKNLLIFFKNKEDCKNNLLRHIASSYYRIKYGFPIHNPLLEEIKYRFKSLFQITKTLFNTGQLSPSLIGIRDEEVAYIVSYLGSYMFKDDMSHQNKYRVLIACPNGITISKTIQFQLERHFPQLEIIDSISMSEIDTYKNDYDYLISTINVDDIENNIVVNPILRNFDLDTISRIILKTDKRLKEINLQDLLEGIKKYTVIQDEVSLKKFLYNIIYDTNTEEGDQYMLKELLTADRIKFTQQSENWMEAIKQAALPLLNQNTITDNYIEAMIDSVKQNGPYIVLDEYFALAHARPADGVKELSMSLLKIDEPVDFLGQEVKVIVVLAATDNTKHLQALASLTDLIGSRENLEDIINANDVDVVIKLIRKYS